MNYLLILINALSVAIFLLSVSTSVLLYRRHANSIEKIEKIFTFSFFLSVFISSCYFLYSLSYGMTLDNIGDYLTVLMHSLMYPSACILLLKGYKEYSRPKAC